jgi:hypothetical protein
VRPQGPSPRSVPQTVADDKDLADPLVAPTSGATSPALRDEDKEEELV